MEIQSTALVIFWVPPIDFRLLLDQQQAVFSSLSRKVIFKKYLIALESTKGFIFNIFIFYIIIYLPTTFKNKTLLQTKEL